MGNGFVKRIFGKEFEDVTLSDVSNFFSSPQDETSIIEFKSGEVEIIDIYKEVAAFLNTEGGLIIIGSPKEKNQTFGKTKVKMCQGDLTFSRFKNKDWLNQKLNVNIVPTPYNIRIKEFRTDNGAVYLLDVPQSKTPPHQVNSDGRYYIRMEAEAKPAPHGLVQALFQMRSKPKLTARINIEKGPHDQNYITTSLHNESKIPADKVSFLIEVYNVWNVEGEKKFEKYHDDLGQKHSCTYNSSQVLARVISFPTSFTVTHLKKNYLIFIGYWAKNSDYNFQFWTFDPVKNSIVNQGDFETSDLTVLSALKKLNFA